MFSAIRAVTGDHHGTSSTPAQPTGPKFPVFLLPSFAMPFRGRRQSTPATDSRNNSISSSPPHETAVPALSSSPGDSTPGTPGESPTSPSFFSSRFTTPVTAITGRRASARSSISTVPSFYSTTSSPSTASQPRRLSRTQPNTIRCSTCSADFAYCSQVVSKGFTGRYGRAYLIAPASDQGGSLLNVKIGKSETRLLVTGSHIVADITCAVCQARIGWKYVDAKEESQKYKVGKFILETKRIVDYRSWEDLPESEYEPVADYGPVKGGKGQWPNDSDAATHEDVVVFDSEDEDDCDDLFSGSWDPAVAAKRRARKVNKRSKS
ncbi:yippee zinc-binding/DNA-binding /Mis18, centromere assembly-domain-containing protein [Microdochium bolleyi]|uniref:Yippee zinc-binding/DNA-binding /Mis18, centromere assembly-domain-containing protein n=1 Tax=Microdochium bolleyi TaxID=196109 RepID=A0A136J4F1_9PEZI|nr:yippee zinc-binding/DNA-binding /Mis18, centromere assembly-domain-containing protein [Microdochium bolleyi]